ncbi:4'-phosphopantetheinyl transferase superfamily protein [Mesorhizobium sp. STM 4661]|uniref:4'-phosphopantetheinyl transferase family protein n=1 Tax=Mesorhizobium sp. STM 4661 TaxID=1297570 RepID=UPI0002BF133E|nr:4'-phosphopantetheinyl transferase superfamily protein [Mesorhizobium sp. STM 4661]CCV10739.1 putative Phosphopantetheinyl transferase PptA [Mesorhizobium sp. STM 4661]
MRNRLEICGTRSPAGIVAAIRQLVPDGVIVEGGDLKIADCDFLIEEELSLSKAVPARRLEFRAGRIYARQALRSLGIAACTIPIGAARAPIWPAGTVGSISHTRSLCCVVTGLSADFLSVGIDIEDANPLSDDLTKLISHVSELKNREAIEIRLDYDLPKLLFVIKEAFYKMYFPLSQRFLTFHDVCVELDVEKSSAKVVIASSNHPPATNHRYFEGRFGCYNGTVFSYFDVPAH